MIMETTMPICKVMIQLIWQTRPLLILMNSSGSLHAACPFLPSLRSAKEQALMDSALICLTMFKLLNLVTMLAVTALLKLLCKILTKRTPLCISSALMIPLKLFQQTASTTLSLLALLAASLPMSIGLIHVQSNRNKPWLLVMLIPEPPIAGSMLLTSAWRMARKLVMADGHSISELELKPTPNADISQLISISLKTTLPILVMSPFPATRSLTHSAAIASILSLLRLTSMALVRSTVNSMCATLYTKSFRLPTLAFGRLSDQFELMAHPHHLCPQPNEVLLSG